MAGLIHIMVTLAPGHSLIIDRASISATVKSIEEIWEDAASGGTLHNFSPRRRDAIPLETSSG